VTSTGDKRCVSARVKNARAVASSRCLRDQDVDDLAVLIDRPVEIGPAAGDLDIRFIDQPAIPERVPRRARGVDDRQ
jgi:hypothetical protein